MAEVPLELPTGRVVGKFIFEVQDNSDPGEEPQLVPVTGDIIIKSSIENLSVFDQSLGKFITFRGPHKAIINSLGELATPDPIYGEPMYTGMSLWSNDSDKLSVKGWTYTATFNLKTVEGKNLDLPPATFTLATGQEVDLADVIRVPATPGYGLPQAEGAALRAESAAVSAGEDAEEALAAAVRAEAVAGATDAGVASLLVDGVRTGAAIDARINTQVTPVVEQITADYIASDQAVIDAAAAAVDANPKILSIEARELPDRGSANTTKFPGGIGTITTKGKYSVWASSTATALGLPVAAVGELRVFSWSQVIHQVYEARTSAGTYVYHNWKMSSASDWIGWEQERISAYEGYGSRISTVETYGPRIQALEDAAEPAITTGLPGQISVWGSSSPAGVIPELTTELNPYGVEVHQRASGGEWSSQTVARIGSTAITLSPANGAIPTSGPVRVTSAGFLDGDAVNLLQPTTGWLGNVHGTLVGFGVRPDGYYEFTRTKPGTTISMTSGQWVPEVKTPAHLNILGAGKNDLNVGRTSTHLAKVITRRDQAVSYWKSRNQDFLTLGHFVNINTPASDAGRTQIEADNADALAKYPDNFINMQALLSGSELWEWTGITPTQADLDQQALGNMPPSIQGIGNHLNTAGDQYLAHKISQWMISRKMIGEGRVPFTADQHVIGTDGKRYRLNVAEGGSLTAIQV